MKDNSYRVVDVAVIAGVAAKSSDHAISRKLALSVVEPEGLAHGLGGTHEDGHIEASGKSVEVSAHSIAENFSSGVDSDGQSTLGLDSDVASERRSRSLGREAGRVQAGILLAATSHNSGFNIVASVDDV